MNRLPFLVSPLIKNIKVSLSSLVLVFVFSASPASAAKLPKNITQTDLNTLIKTLSFGNTTKVLRSAEAYPAFPGLKIAFETTLIHSGKLTEMGNGSASLPAVIPSPRLTISKGLGMGFEAALNLSTQQLLQTMASMGLLGKWTFLDEKDSFWTSALFGSYTRLGGFNDTFTGSNLEVGILASKDYVRLKPYAGMGLLLAAGSVPKSICFSSQTETVLTPHLFFGTEIELPMNVTIQIDFTDWIPTGSLALGYRF